MGERRPEASGPAQGKEVAPRVEQGEHGVVDSGVRQRVSRVASNAVSLWSIAVCAAVTRGLGIGVDGIGLLADGGGACRAGMIVGERAGLPCLGDGWRCGVSSRKAGAPFPERRPPACTPRCAPSTFSTAARTCSYHTASGSAAAASSSSRTASGQWPSLRALRPRWKAGSPRPGSGTTAKSDALRLTALPVRSRPSRYTRRVPPVGTVRTV